MPVFLLPKKLIKVVVGAFGLTNVTFATEPFVHFVSSALSSLPLSLNIA